MAIRKSKKYEYCLDVEDIAKYGIRSNSLTTNVEFYWLLRTEGICADHVELLKTTDALMEQFRIMRNICVICSIAHPEYNWDFENKEK